MEMLFKLLRILGTEYIVPTHFHTKHTYGTKSSFVELGRTWHPAHSVSGISIEGFNLTSPFLCTQHAAMTTIQLTIFKKNTKKIHLVSRT